MATINAHQAQEFQRTRQQGRGKPIISFEVEGFRLVAVGKELFPGNWRTFTDFLIHYLRAEFGRQWGLAEMAKPIEAQHPLIRWLAAWGDLTAQYITEPGRLTAIPETGAAKAVLGLAYDLYLIKHHAIQPNDNEAYERLLSRLRHPDQFLGARHETRAAGLMLRAGFNLEWEDETVGQPGGHGEFIATFPQTGRRFWIECRMCQPTQDRATARFAGLLSSALRKTTQLERVVFVELNLADAMLDEQTGGWAKGAINQLRKLEEQPDASALPSALVFISNFPEHRQLDEIPRATGIILEGFNTNQFRFESADFVDVIAERKINPEIMALVRSMEEHSVIPATFDGSIHGLEEVSRLIIGNTYHLPDGQPGVLEGATVLEPERQAYGVLRLTNGERAIMVFPLSDAELDAWRRHPETFFGELQPSDRPVKSHADLYEFLVQSYAETPSALLLQWMDPNGTNHELQGLEKAELVKRYAYGLTAAADIKVSEPLWHVRLRPRKKQGGDQH